MRFELMEKSSKTNNIEELKAISNRLKELRKDKGYSNYESFCHELGMSRSSYFRLESAHNFNIATLIKICKHLDITLEEFFAGIELPKKSK